MNLVIDELRLDELYDTSTTMDPQDPALTITVGGKTFTTDRQVDARTHATFPNKYSFPITMDYYDNPASVVSDMIEGISISLIELFLMRRLK